MFSLKGVLRFDRKYSILVLRLLFMEAFMVLFNFLLTVGKPARRHLMRSKNKHP